MFEYACHEGNYGLYNIFAGAVVQEAEDGRGGARLMFEYACHEGNYGLYNILAGAVVQEAETDAAARD